MKIQRLSTNSPIDKILDGGIEFSSVTNFYGPPGSGKTNIALSTLLSVKNKKIIFMDTEGSFSFERLAQITKKEETFENVLRRIILLEPRNWQEQSEMIKNLEKIVEDEEIGLIVIDSIVALYRIEINQKNFSDINRELASQYSTLSRISREKNIPILVTNQIYLSGEDVELTSKTIARYWSKTLIELKKTDRPNHRLAILRKHRSLPEGQTIEFVIVRDGLKPVGIF